MSTHVNQKTSSGLGRFFRNLFGGASTRRAGRGAARRAGDGPRSASRVTSVNEPEFDLATLARYPVEARDAFLELYRGLNDVPPEIEPIEAAEHDLQGLASLSADTRTPWDIADRVRRQVREHPMEPVAFPAMALKILDLVENPDSNLSDVVRMIDNEPAISVEILRFANSAVYAGLQPVTEMRDAVVRLGMTNSAQVAASSATRALFDVWDGDHNQALVDRRRGLWLSGLTCAFTSGWAAMNLRRCNMNSAFIGGMLHDIGKNVALRALTELERADVLGGPLTAEEVELVLEDVHEEIGLSVTESWRLPSFLHTVIEKHHQRDLGDDTALREVHLVRLISGLAEVRSNPLHRVELEGELRESIAALHVENAELLVLDKQLTQFTRNAEALVA